MKYEVEIKSLLGTRDRASELLRKLRERGELEELGRHSQLNHYFVAPDGLENLKKEILPLLPSDERPRLEHILIEGRDCSIRTRYADGSVLFVVKASLGDDTSANGVSRLEFEAEVPKTIEELDGIILNAGLEYQAKWSRDREEYRLGDVNITIDRNAGYGYVAEFEKIVDNEAAAVHARTELTALMDEFCVAELPQERLERMFAFYNANWRKYYGTDEIFNIK